MRTNISTPTPLMAGLSLPALRALDAVGMHTLDSIAGESASQLLALHGLGLEAIRILDEALESRGLPGLSD
jgi:hypothetical protein